MPLQSMLLSIALFLIIVFLNFFDLFLSQWTLSSQIKNTLSHSQSEKPRNSNYTYNMNHQILADIE